ncbi:MAG: extracellular solute-binding protein [Oscillibacter sp.]|nr:extracellular solute-binding protein [Oscillibacter sp.]
MKNRSKRLLAFLLSMLMLTSLLAGCGGTSEPAPQGGEVTEGEYTPPADHPYWLCDEKTTLTVTTYDGVTSTYVPPSDDDPFYQWLEDTTNVHIQWEIIPYAGYNEVIQTRLASGEDLSDIINVMNIDNGQAAGENGILLDMAPYWDTYFKNTQEYMDKTDTPYRTAMTNGKGQIFTINGTNEPVEGHTVIMYNTEWMEKLGAKIPETLDEFKALLEQMKAAGDLNGNGKDDEIVLTSANLLRLNSVMGNAFGLENYYYWDPFQADANGKVWHEDTSDNMRALLTFENDLFERGILDQEINTMTASILSEKVAADRVGIFVYYSAFAFSYGNLTTAGQADPYGEHYTLGVPLASEWNGNKGYFVRWESMRSNPTGINAKSDKAALAMRWLDFMFGSDVAIKRRTLGIEGVHYSVNPDGSVNYIYPESGAGDWNGSGENAGQLTLAFIQTKDQLLVTKAAYPWYLEEYANLRDNYEWRSPSVPRVNYFSEEEQEVVDTYKGDFKTYNDEMQAKFVNGGADIDKDWDTFLATCKQLGLDELTAAYQSAYDRMK